MSRIPSSTLTSGSNTSQTGTNPLREVDMNAFLKLMIAELQNQDPLNPMDNAQMLQQIGEIRQIGATDLLTETLNQVLTGQGLTNASSLIGKKIKALTDDAKEIEGTVDRVTVEVARSKTTGQEGSRTIKVLVNGQKISLDNVREVVGGTA